MFTTSKTLVKKYNGKVPKTFQELEELPELHQTASVAMSPFWLYPSTIHIYIDLLKDGAQLTEKCYPNRKRFKALIPQKNIGTNYTFK